ncbi:MAG TPA: hypothetical protein VN231_14645 [Allosphingosinicella sp.]|nr:hypothetical protein [Allosphingosinicella sp.]
MFRRLAFLALAALGLSGASGCAASDEAGASPLPRLAGRTLLAGCRQGECGWMRIVRVESAVRRPEGELRRMTVRKGRSVHPDGRLPDDESDAAIEWEANDGVDYAFCSAQRPAYAFSGGDGGGLTVHFLDLFDLAGYQQVSGGLYLRLCHGRERIPDAAALRRLGYRPGTRSEQVEDGTPETMTAF